MDFLNPLDSAAFPAHSAAFTGTAGSTTPWNAGPEGVLVWSDQPCYVAVGEGVTATTADTPIPAFTPVPFKVKNTITGLWRVSAIQVTAGGTVFCKPLNFR